MTQSCNRKKLKDNECKILSSAYELRLSEFLPWAIDYSREVDRSVVYPQWRSPLWTFVRLVKGHPDVEGLEGTDALKLVETELGLDWYEPFPKSNLEDAEFEFLDAWERVRYVPGHDPIGKANRYALENPLVPPIRLTAGYERFIGVAGWLQAIEGDRNIFLPCEKIGELLDCQPITVSRYRARAVRDGLLRVVKSHRFRPSGGGEATEFRFDLSRFPQLQSYASRARA